MSKLKLMIIVGTRPEVIRLSQVIKKCDEYFDLVLVHTGQNYDYNLNGIFFKDLGLRDPDYYLEVAGNNLGESMGNIIAKSYDLMLKVKPDALLILGDTNSCLSAISAKRLHIPIFHMEAGNRCKDECLPEETNRRIVDIISDVNLPYSQKAREYLIEAGLPKDRTFITGSPMKEVLNAHIEEINKSDILKRLNLKEKEYMLLSAHREENIDNEDNFKSLFNALNNIARTYKLPILYSCHPRSEKKIKELNFKLEDNIIMHEPLGFIDYNHLQMHALCVISDSGTLPEEATYYNELGNPVAAVCIRTSTERPEAMEKGNFILAGINQIELERNVQLAIDMNKNKDTGTIVDDYKDINVSSKVVKIISSYTGVINKMVYRKR